MFIWRPNLYQLGGIQSVSALPGDLKFNQTNNKYDISSYKTVCADFIVDLAADFRFKNGQNHALGYVYVIYSAGSSWSLKKMDLSARHAVKPFDSAFCRRKRVREGQTSILGFIRNEEGADRQYDWFVPDKANGPMQAGLSQLNQSIEAFVYCVREAQVNVLIIILGKGGRAKKNTERVFHFVGERY